MSQVGPERMDRILKGGKQCFSGWKDCMSRDIQLRLFVQTNIRLCKKVTMGTFSAMWLIAKTQKIVSKSKTWN